MLGFLGSFPSATLGHSVPSIQRLWWEQCWAWGRRLGLASQEDRSWSLIPAGLAAPVWVWMPPENRNMQTPHRARNFGINIKEGHRLSQCLQQPTRSWGWWLLFSCLVMSDSLWPHGLQYARLPCPSLSPRLCSNSCPLSEWCHLTISSSVAHFFSCPQSFPASGSFPTNRFFTSGGQSTGAWVSALVLPMHVQGWFPLGLTGLICLLPKGLSRVFSSTTVWKHQIF